MHFKSYRAFLLMTLKGFSWGFTKGVSLRAMCRRFGVEFLVPYFLVVVGGFNCKGILRRDFLRGSSLIQCEFISIFVEEKVACKVFFGRKMGKRWFSRRLRDYIFERF